MEYEINIGFEDFVTTVDACSEDEAKEMAFQELKEQKYEPVPFLADIYEVKE